ncbi:MAG: citryl-CoA lyase [Pigmentiphaga sp.]|uniref:citryl-CoA lyase n=1 Tax=Pigmentiphaga sp. TaxID=1977564 RepID=UPI0029B25ED7|nr:citryl-CoA lyase [Pigmentiphaga sp.]MDX3907392.1 citryl-CoA lyase [Pigmentiphaga sp.]
MAARKPLRTDICWSTEKTITIKGLDLCQDVMGKVSLGDMAFLELTDRLPNERESRVFNALAVILVEHGMTPSAIVTRMTLSGAPEAMQAAVAAGLSGLGSVFVGSMENAARILQEAIPDPSSPGDIQALADRIVDDHAKRTIPGIGHHIHKPQDPRAPRLFEIAAENGYDGPYVALMKAVADTATARLGKNLPVNATGAIAAVASELGIPWKVVRGIGVMSRAIGLVAHVLEELRNPMARDIKAMVEEQATAHLR